MISLLFLSASFGGERYCAGGSLTKSEAAALKKAVRDELREEVLEELREELRKEPVRSPIAAEVRASAECELSREMADKAAAERTAAAADAKKAKARDLYIFGYAQVAYLDDNNPGASSGFNISRIRLLTYKKIDDGLDFYFHGNITGNNPDYSKLILLESVVRYNKIPGFQAWAGQFVIPFGIEVPLGSAKPHMINFAQVNSNLDHEQFNEDLLDVGVRLDFEKPGRPLNLTLAFINGEGMNRRNDTNDLKTIVGRLTYKVTDRLTLGSSILEGKRYKATAAALASYGSFAAATAAGDFDRKRRAADFKYLGRKWFWQGEYCVFETGMAGRTGDLRGKGGYLETGYRIRPKFELALKKEIFTPDIDTPASKRSINAYGFNWYFSARTKLQFAYENRVEPPERTVSNDLFATQFTLEF